MASDDFLYRDNFGLLPEPRDRMASFGLSTVVNLAIASILLLLTMNKIKQAKTSHSYGTTLVLPVKQPKFKVPRPPRPRITAPLIERITPRPPLIVATKATGQSVQPEVVKLDAPPMPAMPVLKKIASSTLAESKIKPSPKTGGLETRWASLRTPTLLIRQ